MELCEAMRHGTAAYRIDGSDGLRRALERLVGVMGLMKRKIKDDEKKSPGLMQRLAKVFSVTAKSIKTAREGQEILEALPDFGGDQLPESSTTDIGATTVA
jgi:hypothetical protein